MKRIRLSARFRAEWARLLACGEYDAAERAKADNDGARAIAAGLARARSFVAARICARWEAAGYTTVRLVDGLPRPERPHPADWHGEGPFRRCGVCGSSWFKRPLPPFCRGPSALPAVLDALDRGVPFGLVDGLPTAGVPVQGDGRAMVARATCQPMREQRRAA